MQWKKFSDECPKEYKKYYLVLSDSSCDLCNKEEEHEHRLDFKRYRYDVAFWYEKDMYLVNWYRSKGDNSWDHYANDNFTECGLMSEEITHWMEFPLYPINKHK